MKQHTEPTSADKARIVTLRPDGTVGLIFWFSTYAKAQAVSDALSASHLIELF